MPHDSQPGDLRSLLAADRETRKDVADWLLAMNDETFRSHVATDVRRQLDSEASAALRDPTVLHRWYHALKALETQVHAQLEANRGSAAPNEEWRRKAARFRAAIAERRAEARACIARDHHQNHSSEQQRRDRVEGRLGSGLTREEAAARRVARRRAINKLIIAHAAEFDALVAEEFDALTRAEAGTEMAATPTAHQMAAD